MGLYSPANQILLENGTPLLLENGAVLINESAVDAPIFITPRYITYEMIARYLAVGQVRVVEDPLDLTGISLAEVNDLMAQAETYIIQTVLSNYVMATLETVKNEPFEALLKYPDYMNTYIQIRNTFIAQALTYIYKSYFAMGGEGNNGEQLIKQQQQIVNNFTAMAMRLDQAGNLQYKNIFAGLKPCANASQRIARGIKIPDMYTGTSIADNSLNSVPDYRWNF